MDLRGFFHLIIGYFCKAVLLEGARRRVRPAEVNRMVVEWTPLFRAFFIALVGERRGNTMFYALASQERRTGL
jgi:hypothetical protein